MTETPLENPLENNDPWETPPSDLDPDLVETSRRLVSKSEAAYLERESPLDSEDKNVPDPRMRALEGQNKYLLDRNSMLVAKLAQLEAVNQQLLEKIAQLQKSNQSSRPWFLRWLGG